MASRKTVDHFCNLTRAVAAWNGFFVYPRGLHPRSACSGDCSGTDTCDSGATAGSLARPFSWFFCDRARRANDLLATAFESEGRSRSFPDSQIREVQWSF